MQKTSFSTKIQQWIFFRHFNSKLSTAAIILAGSALFSRFLGIIRDRMLASSFGASSLLDAYQISFILPDLIFNLFLIGAISAAFIPIFSEFIDQKEKAWKIANSIINLFSIFLLLILGIIFLFVPQIINVLNSFAHLTGNQYQIQHFDLIVNLTRLMLISPLILGISGIVTSMLNSFRHFFLPALAPILYNLGIIIGIIFFVPRFSIYGITFGVMLGALMHLAIQYPALKKIGWRYKFNLDFSTPVKKIILLTIPRTISLTANQASFWVNKILAFTLGAGNLSAYYFAHNLEYLIIGFFGISLATASFPNLVLSSNGQNRQKFIETLCKTLRIIFFFTVPLSFLFFILRENIVRIILGSGRFDLEDTLLTAKTLGYFSISIFAQSGGLLLARAFYAFKDTKTPLYVNLGALVINIILALLWIKPLGTAGLALSFSVASLISFFTLCILLHKFYKSLYEKSLLKSSVIIFFASIVAFIFTYLAKDIFTNFINDAKVFGLLIQTILLILLNLIIYLGIHFIFKSDDLGLVLERMKKIVRKAY